MTNDKPNTNNHSVEKRSLAPGDKPPAGTSITSQDDNRIQQLQEKREALATFRLTQDPNKGFKIDMGDGRVVEDKRPVKGKTTEQAYKDSAQGDRGKPVGQPKEQFEQASRTSETDYKLQKPGHHSYALGVSRQEASDSKTPVEKLQDFMQAATKHATDPEGWKVWAQSEINKFAGIGAGLNEAKDETKAAVAAGWKAMTDGTVVEFLSQPNAINAPVFKTVESAFEAMSRDPEAANNALEALGRLVMKASEGYSNLPDSEKGKVIGKVMFGMINPEGHLKDAEAALKIGDTAATHVDKAVWDTAAQAMKAAEQAAKISPELAQQTKQMLYDYLKSNGLTGPELEYAGIPKGYFDGIRPSEVDAKDNYLALSEGQGYRGDHDVYSRFNTKGRLKSYINEEGEMVPANPEGLYKGRKVTIAEHLNGRWCKAQKANSPYTSFGIDKGHIVAKYGANYVELDLVGLEAEIAAGKSPVAGIHKLDAILKSIEEQPTFPETTKKYLANCAKKDNEILIEGVIPKRFLKVLKDE